LYLLKRNRTAPNYAATVTAQIRFEPRVGQRRDQCVEDVGKRALQTIGVRERAGIRLVREGAIALELQLVEEMRGLRLGVSRLAVIGRAAGRHG
jgi:hypothetical protein